METKKEQILVTEALPWNQISDGQDIYLHSAAALECMRSMRVEVKERCELLESDETYRQLVVYGLVQDYITGDILLLRRNKGQGEKRLEGKKYIGVGGHVNEEDEVQWGLYGTLYKALGRELKEEAGIITCLHHHFEGFIIEHSKGTVSKTHLGAFFHIFVDKKEVNLNTEEAHLHDAKWVDMHEIIKDLAVGGKDAWWAYEGWSQIIFKDYFNFPYPR